MATVSKTRYTPEDLLQIDDRPMPELVDGELVEREIGQEADSIAFSVGRLVGNFVADHDLGLCNGSQGSYQVFPDDPDKVRIPDFSFTKKERLSKEGPARGHGRVAPDLAVEVVSPNDELKEIADKVRDFQAARIPLIWIVYPDRRSVEVHRLDGSMKVVQGNENLDGGDVLPGFEVEVSRLFA